MATADVQSCVIMFSLTVTFPIDRRFAVVTFTSKTIGVQLGAQVDTLAVVGAQHPSSILFAFINICCVGNKNLKKGSN